jgi:preprotein translocase subunit SecA
MYQQLISHIRSEYVNSIFKAEVRDQDEEKLRKAMELFKKLTYKSAQNEAKSDSEARTNSQPLKSNSVGRNDPCPCGSGKKYKKCCGR